MSVKMRLSRHGKKGQPFYHIVIADSRAPRDGRFIAKIGTYNPLTNPAVIDLDFESALEWYQKGAQPSDTVRAILSYKGILYRNHLLGGVKKGAFSQEEADVKFKKWLEEKEAKISAQKSQVDEGERKILKDRLEAEKEVNEARMAEIKKRRAEELKAQEEAAIAAAKEAAAALAEAKGEAPQETEEQAEEAATEE